MGMIEEETAKALHCCYTLIFKLKLSVTTVETISTKIG